MAELPTLLVVYQVVLAAALQILLEGQLLVLEHLGKEMRVVLLVVAVQLLLEVEVVALVQLVALLEVVLVALVALEQHQQFQGQV